MTALCDSPIGREQTVKWIIGDQTAAEHARSFGIQEGKTVRVIGTFFGSVVIALDQARYAIDRDLAFQIKVG